MLLETAHFGFLSLEVLGELHEVFLSIGNRGLSLELVGQGADIGLGCGQGIVEFGDLLLLPFAIFRKILKSFRGISLQLSDSLVFFVQLVFWLANGKAPTSGRTHLVSQFDKLIFHEECFCHSVLGDPVSILIVVGGILGGELRLQLVTRAFTHALHQL